MTNEEIIIQRLNVLTTFMNNVRTLSKKIFQLPPSTDGVKWIATYNETSDENEKFNLTEALGSVYSLTDGLRVIGNIVRDGADFTFETGFEWVINGIGYANEEITRTINDAGTGNHRIDIAVADVNDDIYIIEGFEVPLATAVVQPPTPPNTIFICSFIITESVVGDNSNPIIYGQNNIPLKINILSTDLVTNDIDGFVNYVNDLNPPLIVLETNSLVIYYLTDTDEVYQFVGIGKGTYGLGQTQIAPENVLKLTFSGSGSQDIDQTLANGEEAIDKIILLTGTSEFNSEYDYLQTILSPDFIEIYSIENLSLILYWIELKPISIKFHDGSTFSSIKPTLTTEGNVVSGDVYIPPTTSPETLATREWVDNKVAGLLDLRGNYDASVNAFPTTGGSGTSGAILKGDFWYVSVAGVLNGVTVNIGDSFFALIDSPTASDWQILESNLGYVPEDVANKATTMTGNTTSNIVYLTAKAIYDWAVGLFYSKTEVDNLLDAKEIKHNGIVSTSEKTLTNTTSAQAIYDTDLDAEANCTYEIFGSADFTGLAVVSSYLSFSLLGTATIDSFNITVFANKAANNQPPNMSNVSSNATQITSHSAISSARLIFFGTVRVSGAGTVKPSVAFSSATASMKVSANAKFSFNKIGSNTVTNY